MFVVFNVNKNDDNIYHVLFESNNIDYALNFYLDNTNYDYYELVNKDILDYEGIICNMSDFSITTIVDLNKINDVWYFRNIRNKYRTYKIKQILE